MSTDIENNGFSVHNGVIVVWDEGEDERVLDVLDCMDTEGLLVASERKGCIRFTWADAVPDLHLRFPDVYASDGDSWPTEHVVIGVRHGDPIKMTRTYP